MVHQDRRSRRLQQLRVACWHGKGWGWGSRWLQLLQP